MYFLGDVHGLRPIFDIIEKEKLQDCSIIQVGDLGLGFQEITRDIKNLVTLDEMLIENNIDLYACRGNHDNPIFWDKSKGLNLPKFHRLHLLEDYSVVTVEDKNILCVGGATSIDRAPRKVDVPFPSWWEDEVFKFDPKKLIFALGSVPKLDIVVTHTAPSIAYPHSDDNNLVNHYHALETRLGYNLKQELKEERQLLDKVFEQVVRFHKPTHWFYGHFHSSKKFEVSGVQFKLLNVNQLYKHN